MSRTRKARVHGQRQHEERELDRVTKRDRKAARRLELQPTPPNLPFAPAEDDPEPEPIVVPPGQLSLEDLT